MHAHAQVTAQGFELLLGELFICQRLANGGIHTAASKQQNVKLQANRVIVVTAIDAGHRVAVGARYLVNGVKRGVMAGLGFFYLVSRSFNLDLVLAYFMALGLCTFGPVFYSVGNGLGRYQFAGVERSKVANVMRSSG